MTSHPIWMSLLLFANAAFFAWTMRRRIPPLLAGRKDVRWDRLGERLTVLFEYGFGQRRFGMRGERDSGLAHILVFSAFLVVSLRSLTLIGMGFGGPNFHLPFLSEQAPLGMAYYVLQQLVLITAVIGCGIFLWFRWFQKKERLTMHAEGWVILLTIISLMVTDVMFGSGSLALEHLHNHAMVWPGFLWVESPVGRWLGTLGLHATALKVILYVGFWGHVATVLAFGNFLPYGKHFHIITGLPTVFFQRLPPVGVLTKLDLESSEQFGAVEVFDLSWKELMDTYSCTECGRCQLHCPTYITGKPLSHKEVNRAIRHHIQELGPKMPMAFPKKPAEGESSEAPATPAYEPLALAGEGAILPDATIWACTTCGWCETACPLFIENVPRIVDMRRNKVLMESSFPEEAQRVFNGMEQQSNPWGVGSNKRGDWAEGLDVPIAANLAEAGKKFEYLFFVGCAGSFDDRQKKVTLALVKILKEAKVDFAILGTEESCTGDSARRLGNEYLYQTLAQTNVETFNKYEVKKIITQCPHCFNALANEYEQFGFQAEVVHHAQLIEELIREGRLKLTKPVAGEVTFHDSCYLGRYNGIIQEPRKVLKSVPQLKLVEMPRHGLQGFCCGAGGGRMWLEEKIGQRINQNRVDEAAATGAKTVATSCPFCLTMIKDGIAETGRDDQLAARDIAEIVAESLELTATQPQESAA